MKRLLRIAGDSSVHVVVLTGVGASILCRRGLGIDWQGAGTR